MSKSWCPNCSQFASVCQQLRAIFNFFPVDPNFLVEFLCLCCWLPPFPPKKQWHVFAFCIFFRNVIPSTYQLIYPPVSLIYSLYIAIEYPDLSWYVPANLGRCSSLRPGSWIPGSRNCQPPHPHLDTIGRLPASFTNALSTIDVVPAIDTVSAWKSLSRFRYGRTLPDFPLIMVTRLLRMQNYPTNPVAICKLHTSHRTCFCRGGFDVIPFKQTQNLKGNWRKPRAQLFLRWFFPKCCNSTSWAQWYQCFSHLPCGGMSCNFAGHQALYSSGFSWCFRRSFDTFSGA